jgi:branched-chain amino acid transport system substrate-binding protein
MKRTQFVLTATTIAALVLAACTPAATPAPTDAPEPTEAPAEGGGILRIYSSLPLTGASSTQTTTMVNAIELALEQKTDGGAVCGGAYTVEYTSLDDASAATGKWDEAIESENANQAVGDPEAVAYIGTFNSGAARISIPILNQAEPGPMAMISPANTAIDLTKGEDSATYYPNPTGTRNYMRVVAADDFQGAFAARWAAKLGAASVYIINDGEVYGKGVADQFASNAETLGIEVLANEAIDAANTDDYRTLATQIAAEAPDLVYFGGIVDNDAPQILVALREAGVTVPFMGPDGVQTQAFIDGAGADLFTPENGAVYATVAGAPFDLLPEAGKTFYADYEAKFGAKPEPYAIYAYEAAGVVLNAIEQVCANDRAAILDAMFNTTDYEGVLGTWSFDDNGDTTLISMVGYVVENGAFVEVPADQLPANE